MAYDAYLAERITLLLKEKNVSFEAKKMMGGFVFMVDDKMCVGIVKNTLMARIGTDAYASALQKEHCSEMNFTGRAMKGFVFVDPLGVDTEDELDYWVQLCVDFNPLAKATKKKGKRDNRYSYM
jgi:TfoX/Sxy family transcriptional regulator of competence genes